MKGVHSHYIIIIVYLCLVLLISPRLTQASTIRASTFGYNSINATTAFQLAFLSFHDTVIFDLQSQDWNIGPSLLSYIQNKVFIFEPGVIIKAIPNAFPNNSDCLLNLLRCSNITIIGYGATFAMNKSEYTSGEHRMGISLINCKGVVIKGLVIRDTGGDGIYVAGEGDGSVDSVTYSKNILIEDVKCINNRRQGMSIISVQNMKVKNCLFTLTNGTLPESGMDVEPNSRFERIVNLRFEHCSFTDNNHSGIQLSMNNFDDLTIPISIIFSDCYLSNNHVPSNRYSACEIQIGCKFGNPVHGEVLFERCTVENSQWRGLYSRKTSNAFHVTFKDCVFKDICQTQVDYNNPIFLEVPDYTNASPALGGFTFDNMLITYKTNYPFFRVYGWSTLKGLADIDGKFTIVEPYGNGVLYQKVPDTTNVTFTYSTQQTLPSCQVNLSTINYQALECSGAPATFTTSRQSSDVSYPLPVKINISSTATLGDDIHLMTGAVIIPANKISATDSVIARNDNIQEATEEIHISLTQINMYDIGPRNNVNLEIINCPVFSAIDNILSYNTSVFPNPTTDKITIITDKSFNITTVKILDMTGQTIIEQKKPKSNYLIFNLSGQANGIYIIEIDGEDSISKIKVVKI